MATPYWTATHPNHRSNNVYLQTNWSISQKIINIPWKLITLFSITRQMVKMEVQTRKDPVAPTSKRSSWFTFSYEMLDSYINDAAAYTFSKRLIMSFFKSFWGFSELEGVARDGESLNKSSIPVADWGLLSTALVESFFSAVDVSTAAAILPRVKVNSNHWKIQSSLLKPKEASSTLTTFKRGKVLRPTLETCPKIIIRRSSLRAIFIWTVSR